MASIVILALIDGCRSLVATLAHGRGELLVSTYPLNPIPATLWVGKVAEPPTLYLLARQHNFGKFGCPDFKLWQTFPVIVVVSLAPMNH